MLWVYVEDKIEMEYIECRIWMGKDFCKKRFSSLTAWLLHCKDEHKGEF